MVDFGAADLFLEAKGGLCMRKCAHAVFNAKRTYNLPLFLQNRQSFIGTGQRLGGQPRMYGVSATKAAAQAAFTRAEQDLE